MQLVSFVVTGGDMCDLEVSVKTAIVLKHLPRCLVLSVAINVGVVYSNDQSNMTRQRA